MNTNELIQLYKDGKSLSFLSEKFGQSTYLIKKLLLQNQITIRTKAEQNSLTNQERGKKVNHEFFDKIDTLEKAWLLGFLMADGTISSDRNRIKIGLSSVDREILEKIQKKIQSERNILDYETAAGFKISELVWSSKNHKEKLSKYGIVPNKTYKELHLPNLSKEMKLCFILGYYDGDGCFRNDNATCRWEICSYRPELLTEIANFLNLNYNGKAKISESVSRKNYYTITYSTQVLTQFLDEMYLLSPIKLERKYLKYQEWKNNRI